MPRTDKATSSRRSTRTAATQLLQAAAAGNATAVKEALAAGVPVNCTDAQGATPIELTLRSSAAGAAAALKHLLAAGADISTTDAAGSSTWLHQAASTGDTKRLQLLLSAGCACNVTDSSGSTPVQVALASSQYAAVDVLLKHGVQEYAKLSQPSCSHVLQQLELVNWKTMCDASMMATSAAFLAMVRAAEAAAAASTTRRAADATAARIAAATAAAAGTFIPSVRRNNAAKLAEGCSKLAQLAADIAAQAQRRVTRNAAARTASALMATVLLPVIIFIAGSVDRLGSDGKAALHRAALTGRTGAVQVLLEYGAKPNTISADGWTALSYAAWSASVEVTAQLLAAGADVSMREKDGTTALHHAVEGGSAEVVRQLLDAGADPRTVTALGMTPLHSLGVSARLSKALNSIDPINPGTTTVSKEEQMQRLALIAEMLIAHGADINIATFGGATPLHLAAGQTADAAVPVAQLLLQHGANPNAAPFGFVPLVHAVQAGNVPMLQLLLSAGACPNAPSGIWGVSLLAMAAGVGSTAAVEVLMTAGAHSSRVLGALDHHDVMAYAVAGRHTAVVRLLLAKLQGGLSQPAACHMLCHAVGHPHGPAYDISALLQLHIHSQPPPPLEQQHPSDFTPGAAVASVLNHPDVASRLDRGAASLAVLKGWGGDTAAADAAHAQLSQQARDVAAVASGARVLLAQYKAAERSAAAAVAGPAAAAGGSGGAAAGRQAVTRHISIRTRQATAAAAAAALPATVVAAAAAAAFVPCTTAGPAAAAAAAVAASAAGASSGDGGSLLGGGQLQQTARPRRSWRVRQTAAAAVAAAAAAAAAAPIAAAPPAAAAAAAPKARTLRSQARAQWQQ